MDKINKNQKAFIVTPLIEESEALDEVQSVLAEYEQIQQLYPELQGQI